MPLIIQTYIKDTDKMGTGLFTKNKIQNNAIISIDDSNLDRKFTQTEVDNLNFVFKDYVEQHAGYRKAEKIYYFHIDDMKYLNHSEKPNTQYKRDDGILIAIIDINEDTELTCDYREFCDYCKDGDFGFEIF